MSQGFYGFPNILGLLRGTNLRVLGKAGATAGAGLAGGTTSGAPTSGQFDAGEAVIAQNGHLFICSVAGSPGTWVDAGAAGGLASPLSTKGDLWVYGSADARLGVGADTYVLTADATQSLGLKWAAGASSALTTASAQLGANVSMTTANTWYDGPSVSLAAGTWLLVAGVTILAGVVQGLTAKLWDGTTAYSSGEQVPSNAAYTTSISLGAVVSPGSTTSYKISATGNGGGATMKAATTDNSAGNNATWILAVKVG